MLASVVGLSVKVEKLIAESRHARIELLKREVEAGFTFANVAETERQIGDDAGALRSLEHAEKAYSTMIRFLSDPKHVKHLTDEEHKALTAAAKRLRRTLDGWGSIALQSK